MPDPILHRGVNHKLIYTLKKAVTYGKLASPGYDKGVRVWALLK